MFFNTKQKATKPKNKTCVSFWVEPDIINEYQKLYPSTLSKYVRYCIVQALKDNTKVTMAIFETPKQKTIFD